MDISSNGMDLIKRFEGFRANAYLDIAGVPTIGYGTTRWSNGQLVHLGETISELEAEGELKSECDRIASAMDDALGGVALNQNQADALISFCFNLGVGALIESTLLKDLKAGNFDLAATEFLRWNKATIRGVKTVVPGLTLRRQAESALFQDAGSGGTPIKPQPSDAERVTGAVAFRSGDKNVLVAFDATKKVVEIVELATSSPSSFCALIRTYPNLTDFSVAGADDSLPSGPRLSFSDLVAAKPATRAPRLNHEVLMLGAQDDDDPADHNVKQMQLRLSELKYYEYIVDGLFGPITDKAVRDFQTDVFGADEADGKVGKRTWAKLFGDAQPVEPAPGDAGETAPGKNYLKLTKTGGRDNYGLSVLRLAYYRDGVFAGGLNVCSGVPSRQSFRTGAQSQMGCLEPLPEGEWSIGDIKWKDGRDNFGGAIWSDGLGPATIALDYRGPGRTARQAIEIHIDWNRKTAPGTAGCVGIYDIADFKVLVSFLRDTDPKRLFVDYGLGTCPLP